MNHSSLDITSAWPIIPEHVLLQGRQWPYARAPQTNCQGKGACPPLFKTHEFVIVNPCWFREAVDNI